MIYFMGLIFILCPIFLIAYDYFKRFKGALLGHYLPASKNPKVFLTYDDGPHFENSPWGHSLEDVKKVEIKEYDYDLTITQNLLNLFKSKNINALFYVHGESMANYFQDYQTSIVGNHGFSHKNSLEIDESELVSEFQKAHSQIQNCQSFRPPGGSWRHDLTEVLWKNNLNYSLPIYWDFDTKDYEQKEISQQSYHLIDSQIENVIGLLKKKKNVVILQHDVWIYSYLFTQKLLERLEKESFEVGLASELISESKRLTELSKKSKFLYYLNLRFNQLRSGFYRLI